MSRNPLRQYPTAGGEGSRLRPGDLVPRVETTSIRGTKIQIPAGGDRLVHLQFRRYAGCPICNLHLRTISQRADDIAAAGVLEVAVFHSEAATMIPFQGSLPFEVLADPTKVFYRAFGVETSVTSLLHPSAWCAAAKGMVSGHLSGTLKGEGGHLGLPADFLISPTGQVLAVKYGKHADDQWSVEEIIALAGDAPRAR